MKGLLLKDIFTLRKQFSMLALIFVFYSIWGYFVGNYVFLSSFMPFIFTMMVLTSFSYDDASKWTGFALSLPVSRKCLVLSKYALTLILTFIGAILSLVFGYLLLFISREPVTEEILVSSLISSFLCLLFSSIMIPLVFKSGVEKSRTAMFFVIMIPSVLLFGALKIGLFDNVKKITPQQEAMLENFLPAIFIAVALAALAISFFISLQIVRKKEF